ncbi:IclR family transcriptional regulator [Mycobacterium hodleri]|uniref:Glycerol operon regulatory protein n=1 Tax=Mycolicibacterium hodleri TaxID=49897 RepID=A0A544VZ27_9MYCO|nr:IclR family transcriptional regulator [Mycolicibacterium hodleri]TQR85249.1 IclR family transcriptional regulator [Mycolicibacterium hodleri]
MSSARSDAAGGGVQSVDRALVVLEILARLGEAGVTEIASELDVHKSTASRLLSSLEDRDLVEQLQDRGKYRLGVGILRLANAVSGELDVVQQGRDICERLAADVGETVNVAVRRSRYVVNVDQARGPSAVGTHNWVGELTPLHATSSGKVLLASMPARMRRELLGAAPLTRFTDRTITSVDELERQLDAVADDEWVLSVGEFEAGLNAVAAPIRDHGGVAIAALSVSGPVYRLDEARMQEIGPKIASSAAEIGRRMGHLG